MKKTTVLEIIITMNVIALLNVINNKHISPTGLIWCMSILIITLIIFCAVYMGSLTARDIELENDLYEHTY